jgi:hypothetical protein
VTRSPNHRSRATAIAAVLVAVIGVAPGGARAFHSGGVAECDGCHRMHDTPDAVGQPAETSAFLLKGADASSRCLYCHSGTKQDATSVLSTQLMWGSPPVNFSPGGDFAWLKKSFTWNGAQRIETSPGERHGHSVVAADFELERDRSRTTAPGGTYPADKLSCTSCHDPHARYRLTDALGTIETSGKPIAGSGSHSEFGDYLQPTTRSAVGVYRLLGGVGYRPKSLGGTVAPFSASPPTALAPTVYNQSESFADVRVAYGAGMSEWCGNCHGALHTPSGLNTSSFRHPSGASAKLGAGRHDSIYNAYAKGGDLAGNWVTAYTSLVPFEEGTTDRAMLAERARSDGSARTGPRSGGENVMCLSCHRAHASGWDGAMRWNQRSEFIVASGQWPGMDSFGDAAKPSIAQGRTQAETRGAMYDRAPSAYAAFQTSLCNKCHAK